ncbi:MAG: virulence factor Mce family protein [Solirubrobacterales bacterium]|nr:virulence factor Mce family protein [Solirubrobacterales bacterium]
MNQRPARFGLHLIVTAALVLVAGAGFLVLMVMGGGISAPGKKYEVKAVLPTVASLVKGSRVTMSGAEVGKVTKVSREGLGAMVELQLTDEAVFPLPKDSTIRLRQHTPVGENYVSIEPGTSPTKLDSGATLPMSSAGDFVDVDEVLSTLSGSTRRRARDLIQSTGAALDGRGGKLNTVIGGVTGTINPTADVVHVAHRDRRQIADLVLKLGQLTAGVGERDAAIRTVADQGLQTVRAVGDKDAALRRLLRELPATLTQVRTTSGTVGRVTDQAAPVLTNLATAIRQVRPAVRLLAPAAQEGRGVVAQLGAAAPQLQRTLSGLRALAGPTVKALPELKRTMCQLNPAVKFLQPYTQDVASFIVGMGSSANSYDAIGHVIRLIPVVSENDLANLPDDVSQGIAKLVRAGLIGKTSPLTFYPIPKPNETGKTAKDLPNATGPLDLAKKGYKYPRVEAEC